MELDEDLEGLRKRPSMYVGDTKSRGLHQLFVELLDNSIDQFLAQQVTTVTATTSGSTLEFTDDGPGLPFDEPGARSMSLASEFLTQIRRDSPTADGHLPHIHLHGYGCGLCIVSGLAATCEVTSVRNNKVWRQSFSKGVMDGPPQVVSQTTGRGTQFRVTVDRGLFSGGWCQNRIDQSLWDAAHLFHGLRVQTPSLELTAPRGLADLAFKIAVDHGAITPEQVWWFDDTVGDLHIEAAIAGAGGDTVWRGFVNGSTNVDKGTHLTAIQRVVAECKVNPAAALIHVIMRNPTFTGPTRSVVNAPEIMSPIYHALKPSLKAFAETL